MSALQRQSKSEFPVRFTPKGLVDALDATDKFLGACIVLKDLIFDQQNQELMVARPGVKLIADFALAGFASPGVISVQTTIGDVTYGLIASARNSGKDEPFAYNNATSAFVTVSGITNANSPTTQLTSGAWTPPTLDAVVGTLLLCTHPGFPGGATKFGWFDITNPAAPTWQAGDTATNALPSVPVDIANFNNRAYFACGQFLPYSDVLAATTRTNASQALTIGDTSPIVTLNGLPIQTTSSGIAQSLLVFKAFQIWQVTGDGATLAQNYLSLNIGTQAPRSTAASPYGVYFSSGGGPFVVDTFGIVRGITYKLGENEPDIQIPFQNAQVPSRIVACYSQSIYRVCIDTIIRGTESTNDYWFDERRRRWTGPHSFAYDDASPYSNYMILSSNANPGKLYKSQLLPDLTSQYVDDTLAYTPQLQSSTFPKEGHMTQKQVIESTIELSAAGASQSYILTAQDDQGNTLGIAAVAITPGNKVWGGFVWGDGTRYASTNTKPKVYNVPWGTPLVFQKISLSVSTTAAAAIAIGTFFARYQDLGYTNTELSGPSVAAGAFTWTNNANVGVLWITG